MFLLWMLVLVSLVSLVTIARFNRRSALITRRMRDFEARLSAREHFYS
ncbi:MAG: hypothetical protein KGK08_12615 [Acidobacteriota bacterium]|nr:hypothetical protein [Acidobacteriota bacterium]